MKATSSRLSPHVTTDLQAIALTVLQASGHASRRDVNIVLVLDRSGSMTNSNSCKPMGAAAKLFTDMFVDGRDQLSLITFQTTANVDFAPSRNFKTGIEQQLSQMVCEGFTNSAWGLSLAYDQIKQVGWPGALNVVVFFSDGQPNTVRYANLPTRNQATDDNDYRYDINNRQESPVSRSPCTSPTIPSGILTSPTKGVLKDVLYPIDSAEGNLEDSSHLVPAGCFYNGKKDDRQMRYDIAYIPAQDYYGNPTAGTLNPKGSHPFNSTILFPSDLSKYVYGGQLRPDVQQNLDSIAFNTADNAAYRIRNDMTYKPIVYTIGLGTSASNDFMERLANDPRASSYDNSKQAGKYYYAPTATQLAAIFQQIASQVLRISQ